MAQNEIFEYTYSAEEQTEIKNIREKYLPKEVTKMDRLRALDQSVTERGRAVAIVHGVIFSLLLGLGMSFSIVWAKKWFLTGILIGCIGIVGVAAAYPIYKHIVKQDRERIAPEILRLSEELMIGLKT